MIMSRARARNDRGRRFEELTDAEIVALAINNEEEASRTCRRLQSSGLVLANGANSCSD
jgi:hypothetical protein